MKSENTYIMNLEACYIYKDIIENKKITYKNKDLIKLFSATIPYSLETIRINNMFPSTFYQLKNKQYTRKIINVTFDKHYTKWDKTENKRNIIANKKKIRRYLYKNGFIMDGVKYIFYKRGAGKAKNGFAFYIEEDMKIKLLDRSHLGIKFEENEELDLTSLLAYESLITSGIEFTINLDPKTEILLIDDIYGLEFESFASVTEEINGKIITGNKKIKLKNCLTDGQSLLDESIFEKYNKNDKGFMLLRSDMFKSCSFNTKLQKWFEYNKITEIKDMFGNVYNTNNVKLVITPNSLKFLKFAYKFTESKTKNEYDDLNTEDKIEINKKCYEYWINNIDNIFGVVKCDKEGNYGNYNRITYQLLNSIPNITYEDLMEITKLEREYVMLLKNDMAVFKNYLGYNAKLSLKLNKDLEEDDVSLIENTDLMSALLLVNSDIQYTTKFKKIKSDLIANYIGHIREGKIRVKDTKYLTLISNPYEMILATINKYENKSIMEGREIYCKYYNDNQDFCASRNPHVNSGNVMYTINKYHEEYGLWFNFTDNICAINFFDNDAPDRLQGCDTDSDTLLLVPHTILSSRAKYCEETFPTPINRVKGSSKLKKYNMNELYKLDAILSNNYIGKIINLSQIINSYLSDALSKNEPWYIVDELYQASSKLSSMSQIEIDKSKKVFDNISMSKELGIIRKINYIRYVEGIDSRENTVNKMVVPKFFSMISDSNEFRVFEKFNTPLDILQDVLEFECGNRLKGEKHKEFIDLLVKSKELDGVHQTRTIDSIFKIIEECGKKINGLKLKSNILNEKSKNTIKKKFKKEAIDKLKKVTPSEVTILNILKYCFGNKIDDKLGFKKYGMLTLNLLFVAKKIQVLKCFKNTNININEILIKIKEEYDYNIFGEKFQKINIK